MYEKWLADDKEDLKITKEQIAEYQAKLNAVKESQGTSGEVLAHKELILVQKEDVLAVRPAAPRFQRMHGCRVVECLSRDPPPHQSP